MKQLKILHRGLETSFRTFKLVPKPEACSLGICGSPQWGRISAWASGASCPIRKIYY